MLFFYSCPPDADKQLYFVHSVIHVLLYFALARMRPSACELWRLLLEIQAAVMTDGFQVDVILSGSTGVYGP